MIEVAGLNVARNGREVLQEVALTARPGQVTVLLGPNGSGKTTLFLCINGQLSFQAGRIFLEGEPLARLQGRDLARLLATVPQEHHPVFPYAVRDIILLGRIPRVGFWSQPTGRDRQKVEEVMELMGLIPLADKPYTNVSGGERQLVLIGRCLAQEPRMLLLDEPTSHLDLKNQVRVLKLVRDLAHLRGLTVLLTLHDPNLALLFADRVALMDKGRVVAMGTPEEVVQPEAIERLYGVEVGMLAEGKRRLLYPVVS